MDNFWVMAQVIAVATVISYAIIFMIFVAFIICLMKILFSEDEL